MSLSSQEEIRCPCGEVFEADIWNSINAVEDPELKDAIINGEINIVSCPRCGQIFYAEHFLLYHDSENELLAFVYPSSFVADAEHWQKKMEEDFKKATEEIMPEGIMTYKPILMFGLDSLVELIRDEQELEDESSVLKYFAESYDLSILDIKPYFARANKIPRTLPVSKAKDLDMRAEIIEGIKVLLKHNSLLSHYENFLKVIENNLNWQLDKSFIAGGESKKAKKHAR
jgi:hypothetical protein